MNDFVVLMTACIDPVAGKVQVHRNNPSTRLRDYCDGLRFWLEVKEPHITGVVFVENSGHSLDDLRKLAAETNPWRRKIDFVSLDDNDYPADGHYGYAELGMIDQALCTSKLMQDASHFIKASGRLTFPGIGRLLRRIPSDCLFAVDCRDNSFLTKLPQVFVSSQLMIFSTAFYREKMLGPCDAHRRTLLSQAPGIQRPKRRCAALARERIAQGRGRTLGQELFLTQAKSHKCCAGGESGVLSKLVGLGRRVTT